MPVVVLITTGFTMDEFQMIFNSRHFDENLKRIECLIYRISERCIVLLKLRLKGRIFLL